MVVTAPAGAAEPTFKSLGTDAQADAVPGADIIELSAARDGTDLLIRFHMSAMLPVQGGYPKAGTEWTFDVGAKTFVAEGHPEPGGAFKYTLYEVVGGSFSQKASLDGQIDALAGHMTIRVPLSSIGARRGTKISGTGPLGTEDVDIHLHADAASQLLEAMATTKDFVVR
jgi:hypothetical protein